MAWLTTDWEGELNQVEEKINRILDEKVEPMLERMIDKASNEITITVAKVDFELRDNTDRFLKDIEIQRQHLVSDLKSVVRYAASATLLVVAVSVVLVKWGLGL